MSKPAARLGDMTAHGGTIVAGQPNVLIGGMPAARVTDMHVCPMVNPGTPPPPHIGGPVSMGSAGVLIGGMPAARVGDMAVCAGPPDSIVMGCFTVLIGEVGSGSAGGGGAGGGAATSAQASAATAQFDTNESTTKEEHWVEFKFVDAAGLPVSGVPYTFEDPDGNVSEGVLRMDGTVRRDAISEGSCEVVLRDVYAAAWESAEATTEDKLAASAKVEGFEDGSPAQIQVIQRDLQGADDVVADIKTKVQGGKVEVKWHYEYPSEVEEQKAKLRTATREDSKYTSPSYYFEVHVGGQQARSAMLDITDHIELDLRDDEGNPLGNLDYEIITGSGERRTGTLDGSGKATIDNIPPADCTVRFPELPDREASDESFEADSADDASVEGAGMPDRPPGTVCLRLRDHEGVPFANEAYTLDLDGRTLDGTTNRHGWTEPFELQGAREGQLQITDHTFELSFGDPKEGVAFAQSALNALGFEAGEVTGKLNEQTRAALLYYQQARYLNTTGELDDLTLDQLRAEYAT